MSQPKGKTAKPSIEVLKFTYQGEDREHAVRVIMWDGDAWFSAYDVCDVLHLHMLKGLFTGTFDTDRVVVDPASLIMCDALGPPLHVSYDGVVWLMSERRFYELASNHGRQAHEFKRWMMHEVLPTIRHLNLKSTQRADLVMVRQEVSLVKTPKPRDRTRPHSLYRFFDSAGNLLYVGITWNVTARVKQHRTTQPWWSLVRNMTVEAYPNEQAALKAEMRAIRTEHPLHNVVGKPA